MTYKQALDYLYSIAPPFHEVGAKAYKPGLDTMLRMMQALGVPVDEQRSAIRLPFDVVHVAGTNGKGSTSHLIAAALAASGKRVGLYTSPHLVDFTERVRVIEPSAISDQPSAIRPAFIPEDYVASFVETNHGLIEALQPSFFEITTAMAFSRLMSEQVDVAVIEVGLGGLLDATNIVLPALTVITNIGFDHVDLLGHTLAEIASQKAGIMKAGVPCVIGETDAQTQPVFLARARECGILGDGLETTGCRIWLADECEFLRRQRLRYAPLCELQGAYQQHNMQTAFVALRALGVPVEAIADGFAHVVTYTGLRGRWEILSLNPLVICDTGHNSHGVRTYVQQLLAYKRHLHIVFGMVSDKDVDEVLRLLPENADYYFTQPDSHRALPACEMLARWRLLHSAGSATAFADTAAALRAALTAAKPDDIVFIGGSNYVVGEVLRQELYTSPVQDRN